MRWIRFRIRTLTIVVAASAVAWALAASLLRPQAREFHFHCHDLFWCDPHPRFLDPYDRGVPAEPPAVYEVPALAPPSPKFP